LPPPLLLLLLLRLLLLRLWAGRKSLWLLKLRLPRHQWGQRRARVVADAAMPAWPPPPLATAMKEITQPSLLMLPQQQQRGSLLPQQQQAPSVVTL
jgi:hypothetical protein